MRQPDGGDPMPEFLAFCSARRPQLEASLASRFPQTNEIGRSALFLAGFDRLEPGPKAHLDLGASAGLNLLVDKLAYRNSAGDLLGDSAVVLDCSVRGEPGRLATRPQRSQSAMAGAGSSKPWPAARRLRAYATMSL